MAAINHCEMMGYEEEDIIIDSILGGTTRLSHFDADGKNSFQIMSRSSELWKYYQSIRGVMRAKNGHTAVNFRYLIGPQFNMPTKMLPIQFDSDETRQLLDHGERDANTSIDRLLNNPDAEFELRLNSPFTMKYYNKDRQEESERQIKTAFDLFIQNEQANMNAALESELAL